MRLSARFAAAAVVGALLSAAGVAAAQEAMKFAYVDLMKALNESKAGEKAIAELRKFQEEIGGGLKKQKELIEKKKDELDKQGLLLSEDTRKGRENEIRNLERDLTRSISDNKQKLMDRESELTAKIRDDLVKLVEKIGKEGGYTLILEKKYSAVLYAPAALELTETLIKRYDAEGGK